jgi:RNA polymerase sigma-70 factor (ECF subfamily)
MYGGQQPLQRRVDYNYEEEEQIKLMYARECIPMNGIEKFGFMYLKAKTIERITTLSISKYARVKMNRIKETKKKY